jgi:hypothetical protein
MSTKILRYQVRNCSHIVYFRMWPGEIFFGVFYMDSPGFSATFLSIWAQNPRDSAGIRSDAQ